MPADTTHPVVAPLQPPDNNIKVWRYLDVIKLAAMLETRSLHFARADKLGDPFEGSIARLDRLAHEELFATILKNQDNRPPEANAVRHTRDELRENLSQFFRDAREWMFVSCWHSGETESLAMWNQYGSSGGSVVIQSTYQKLLDALPSEACVDKDSAGHQPIYIGMVQYKDYLSHQEGVMLNSNMMSAFIHKRTAYEYEKEVRAFLMTRAGPGRSIRNVYVNVDFEQLVET